MNAQRPELNADQANTSHDARALVSSNDDGRYIRTAIVLGDNNGASVDVIDNQGKLVTRLNIAQFADSFNVDVIPITDRRALRAAAWHQGDQVMNNAAPVGSLIAVIGNVPASKEK